MYICTCVKQQHTYVYACPFTTAHCTAHTQYMCNVHTQTLHMSSTLGSVHPSEYRCICVCTCAHTIMCTHACTFTNTHYVTHTTFTPKHYTFTHTPHNNTSHQTTPHYAHLFPNPPKAEVLCVGSEGEEIAQCWLGSTHNRSATTASKTPALEAQQYSMSVVG